MEPAGSEEDRIGPVRIYRCGVPGLIEAVQAGDSREVHHQTLDSGVLRQLPELRGERASRLLRDSLDGAHARDIAYDQGSDRVWVGLDNEKRVWTPGGGDKPGVIRDADLDLVEGTRRSRGRPSRYGIGEAGDRGLLTEPAGPSWAGAEQQTSCRIRYWLICLPAVTREKQADLLTADADIV